MDILNYIDYKKKSSHAEQNNHVFQQCYIKKMLRLTHRVLNSIIETNTTLNFFLYTMENQKRCREY